MTCWTFITTILLVAELCQCGTESCESISECVWMQRFVCVRMCLWGCHINTLAFCNLPFCLRSGLEKACSHSPIHQKCFYQLTQTASTNHNDTHSYALVAVEAEHQCQQVLVCLLMTDIGICFQSHHQTTCYLQACLINNTISDHQKWWIITV